MKIYVATDKGTAKVYVEGSMETLKTRLREFKGSEFSVAQYHLQSDRSTLVQIIEQGVTSFNAEGSESFRVNDSGQLRRVP